MSFFTISIQAKTEEERQKRIADNKARGFELTKVFEHVSHANVWRNNGYRDEGGQRVKHVGTESNVHYCAVMRRDNTEYLRQKRLAQ